MRVLADVANVADLQEQLRRYSADIVLLDLNMPGKHGLEGLKEIAKHSPRTRVLILSGYAEDQFARRALKAGAWGYLSKEGAPDQLVIAIRKVHSGAKYVSPTTAEQLASDLANSSRRPPHESLSDRELQVFLALAAGRTVTEISEQLHLSAKTISTYRSRILEKLKARSNADLTRYALENKLID